MTVPLPQAFLETPLAHRALHDRAKGVVENSLSAVLAAVQAGYGIEIDVQLTADEQAVVFHDYDLDRLTGQSGPVRDRTLSELQSIALTAGDASIPSLAEVLNAVAGQVPLLIEIKDQDGGLGPNVGPLEKAVAADIAGYVGPLAVMSFNPHAVAQLRDLSPGVPRGLVTDPLPPAYWPNVSDETRKRLTAIADFDALGATFISHYFEDLGNPRVTELKAQGAAILCWTIRSLEDEEKARQVAQNITFEGYSAPQHRS